MAKFTDITLRLSKGTPLTYQEGDANFQNLQLATAPIGAIMMYAAYAELPLTWLECNGQLLPSASYGDLYSIIGNVWGGDATNFALPDTRGLFMRGYHAGSANDPDYATRVFGAVQWDDFKAHVHEVGHERGTSRGSPDYPEGAVFKSPYDDKFARTTGGAETRPRNNTVVYLIKASVD